MFMIRQWGSTDAAFAALNTQPDNMLNHKEWQSSKVWEGV